MFSQNFLASIFNETWLKRDLAFDGFVIFIHYKMVNLDSIRNENNRKWLYILDHPMMVTYTRSLDHLMIDGSKSRKINALIYQINEQNYIDKIYLCGKDLSDHEIFYKQRKSVGIKHHNDPNAFTEFSNMMDEFYKIIDDYNSNRNKILIVFDDMIADIMANKLFHAKIEELFERFRKLNISLVCIAQSCFAFLKDVRLNFA